MGYSLEKYDNGYSLVFSEEMRKLDDWLCKVYALKGLSFSEGLFDDIHNIPEENVEEYKQRADFAVNTLREGYETWKVQRERFFTGRMGGFYDFGELSMLVADFAKFRNCTTYAGMARELKRYVMAHDFENDNFYKMYHDDLKELFLEKDLSSYDAERHTIGVMLQSNRRFNVFTLSYLYIKLLPMAKLELELGGIDNEV